MSETWVNHPLSVPRDGCGSVTLQNGDILVFGGITSPGVYLSSAEVFDHVTETWSTVGSLSQIIIAPISVLLNDGTVLCAGGSPNTPAATAVCEIYDPVLQTWSLTGSMITGRYLGAAYLLGDGTVLAAGGYTNTAAPTALCEVYDPNTGMWSSTGALPEAYGQSYFGMLGDGRPILAGGLGGSASGTKTHTYSSGTWTTRQDLPTAVQNDDNNSVVSLPDGNFIILMPLNLAGTAVPQPFSYLYNQVSNTWSTKSAADVPHNSQTYLLPNGKILVPGGMIQVGPNINTELVDVYDPSNDTWESITPLPAVGILGAQSSQIKGPLFKHTIPMWVGEQRDILPGPPIIADDNAYLFITSQGATMSNKDDASQYNLRYNNITEELEAQKAQNWAPVDLTTQASGGITELTGDVTAGPGSGSEAATLATVNSNVGTFASVTVNGKGLVTAAGNLTGDITSSSAATTLATVNGNVGSFTSANITVNAKGLITAAANGSGGGQILPQTVFNSSTSTSTTSSGTLVACGPSASITMQGASNKVKITCMGALNIGTTPNGQRLSILKDGTPLEATMMYHYDGSIITSTQTPCTLVYVDTPGDTSAHTYQAAQFADGGGFNVSYGAIYSNITLEEILI